MIQLKALPDTGYYVWLIPVTDIFHPYCISLSLSLFYMPIIRLLKMTTGFLIFPSNLSVNIQCGLFKKLAEKWANRKPGRLKRH
ncbi:hypothetical protein C9I92_21340 [Photobacterium ganghwense]|uniref:Uncharacterized protein n=1 Tax=Photobacterium ganghwense TaxID=320778 RepID=A0A0J1HEN5_9GAMM|nr:hypothetical protein ABT57_05805 [Photobacterium ganghwense]PSU05343.1 hypothetical protein C9I92_21340 [Photobacterium ganghwense]